MFEQAFVFKWRRQIGIKQQAAICVGLNLTSHVSVFFDLAPRTLCPHLWHIYIYTAKPTIVVRMVCMVIVAIFTIGCSILRCCCCLKGKWFAAIISFGRISLMEVKSEISSNVSELLEGGQLVSGLYHFSLKGGSACDWMLFHTNKPSLHTEI